MGSGTWIFFVLLILGCLKTSTLFTLSLDLIIAVYPLILMILSYFMISLYDRNYRILVFLWRPFKTVLSLFQRNWDIRTSLIDSFATFLFLSNIKFLSVSYDLLMPVAVYELTESGNYSSSQKLFYDATISYFGKHHFPYAIAAIIVLVVFVIMPAVLLLLYPFGVFQKILNTIPIQWHILHTFMDSFYGSYKDGTESSSKDCRWFASVFFFFRYLLLALTLYVRGSAFYCLGAITATLLSISLVLIKPFKYPSYSNIAAVFVLLYAFVYASITGVQLSLTNKLISMTLFFYILTALFACLPPLYVTAITFKWIFTHGLKLIKRFRAMKEGYQLIQQ